MMVGEPLSTVCSAREQVTLPTFKITCDLLCTTHSVIILIQCYMYITFMFSLLNVHQFIVSLPLPVIRGVPRPLDASQ